MFRFSSDHTGLFLLTDPPQSGRSGWVCRSTDCVRFLLKNPGCTYRALKKKIRNSNAFGQQLKTFLFNELCESLIFLYRSGTIITGKVKIEKNIKNIFFIMTSRQKQHHYFKEVFPQTEVVLFKETPKLMNIALHNRNNSVISILLHKEAFHFKEILLLWSELFRNDTIAENQISRLKTKMLTEQAVL